MEYKVEKISLIEYLKRGLRELRDNINGKKEETDIASMDTISEDTRKQLLDSLKERAEYAQEFEKEQEVSETGKRNKKRTNKEIQSNLEKNEVVQQYRETESTELEQDGR